MFKSRTKLFVALFLIAGTANVFAGGPGETYRNSPEDTNFRKKQLANINSAPVDNEGEGSTTRSGNKAKPARPARPLTKIEKAAVKTAAKKAEKRAKKVATAAAITATSASTNS